MSAWEDYLNGLDDETRACAVAWVGSRPPDVRAFFRRFPPNSTTLVGGKVAYVVGVAEGEGGGLGLWLSHTNPAVDYDKAVGEKFLVCGGHLPDTLTVRDPHPKTA